MKKNIIFISIILMLLGGSVTFIYYNISPPTSEYITITYSQENSAEENIYTKILMYDVESQKTKEVFQFEYTAQYPLGFYDAKSEQAYYSKRINIEDNMGDQIYSVDLKTKKEVQLTSDLFAVNYIIADGSKVFFVGRPNNSQVLKLGMVDLKTSNISYWGDDDTNVETIAVDRKHKKIIISAYSEKERVYNVTHQYGPLGQDNMKMPIHTVYETDYNFLSTNKLISEELWIRTVMVDDKNIYALCDRKYNNSAEPSIFYRYDIDSKIIYQSVWDSYRLQVGDANYSSNGKHIYSISNVDGVRGIYDFDLDTGTVTPIMIQDSGFINNIQVVRN